MRISGTTGAVGLLIALAVVGGGTYFFRTVQENRKLELQTRNQQAKLETKAVEAKAKESEARSKEADARKAEAERKKAAAEAEAQAAVLAQKKQEEANLKERTAAAAAETKRAAAQQAAAEAESVKAESAKAAAEAKRAELEKKAEVESLALKRAQAEQKTAEAALAEKLAAKKIAEAALAKSENERKAAEATAAAEHDRKLRMYSRANTSRAEMLALQRAEKLLALEESGALAAAGEEGAAGEEAGTPGEPPAAGEAQSNAVVAVTWPAPPSAETPAGEKVAAARRTLEESLNAERARQMRQHIHAFGPLVDQAVADGRAADAVYYRQTLTSLVPDYIDVYAELVDEARKAGDAKAESKRLDELIALVPDWQRVAVFVQLIRRDEAYYSRVLAGRVGKDEFVKAFRKIYDEARRDKGERDERDAKVEHICKLLATYVPDFEHSPEWK
ncbi:MAG: hypothetical protein ACI4RA_00175 [Kiritimatiellia bacterium]